MAMASWALTAAARGPLTRASFNAFCTDRPGMFDLGASSSSYSMEPVFIGVVRSIFASSYFVGASFNGGKRSKMPISGADFSPPEPLFKEGLMPPAVGLVGVPICPPAINALSVLGILSDAKAVREKPDATQTSINKGKLT